MIKRFLYGVIWLFVCLSNGIYAQEQSIPKAEWNGYTQLRFTSNFEDDIMFEAHVDMNQNISISEFETILEQIKTILLRFEISHYTIQPEYETADNKELIHK